MVRPSVGANCVTLLVASTSLGREVEDVLTLRHLCVKFGPMQGSDRG
jgi:hypothetical protein